MKIMFFSVWGESPEDLLRRYSLQTPNENGVWEDVVGTCNLEESDFCIMLEGEPDDIPDIPKEKKIFFKREPYYLSPKENINRIPSYRTFTYDNGYSMATWWISKSFNELSLMSIPQKTLRASAIVSGKNFCKGHSDRVFLFALNYIH